MSRKHCVHHEPSTSPSSPTHGMFRHKSQYHHTSFRKSHWNSKKEDVVDPLNWGFPGYLTPEEKDVYDRFKKEVDLRGGAFRDAIFCFGEEEDEEYALCRWLRARKFILDDVISMIEEAIKIRTEPSKHKFYPDASKALGVDESIFKTQYPQIYYGHAKNCCPLFISKPGQITTNGIECITTIENMHKYQWHVMVHQFSKHLKERQVADPNFKRFQSVAIIDLEYLSHEIATSKVYELVKHQSMVDSLCFPETLNKMIIVNAPIFFSAIWKMMKHWQDPRTIAKVEIISKRTVWENRLRELIDLDQLPSDYGGNAESIAQSIIKEGEKNTRVIRRIAELLHIRANASILIKLEKGETIELRVYTRSTVGAFFSVHRIENRHVIVSNVHAVFHSDIAKNDSHSTTPCTILSNNIKGPGQFKINAHAHRNPFFQAEHYLIVGDITAN